MWSNERDPRVRVIIRKRGNTVCNMPALLLALLVVMGLQVAAIHADNLATLSGTLKMYQRAACNEETMTLRCPPGTSISIAFARYGRVIEAGEKCNSHKFHAGAPVTSVNETCLLPQALQYSLLQTVVEICQKKRNCKFNTDSKIFENDPCPSLTKFTEVAYRCRPYEFRSKVACENDAVNLFCYPGKRVAILSASFGRTEYESLQCPQLRGVMEETCTAPYATDIVIKLCHGKRQCSVIANTSTFGNTCKPDTRTYLKIIYTCVPRSVLREPFVGDIEPDEVNLPSEIEEGFDRTDFKTEFSPSPNLEGPLPAIVDNGTTNSPTADDSSLPRARTNSDKDDERDRLGSVGRAAKAQKRLHLPSEATTLMMYGSSMNYSHESEASPDDTTRRPMMNRTVTVKTLLPENQEVVGYLSDWINAYSFITNNQEKFYLYIIVSVTAGVVLFLGLVIGRLLMSRHRAKRDTKFHENNEALPNGFADEISEIDADIDLTTPVPVPIQDTRIPETQLTDRLHGERYFTDTRMPMQQIPAHAGVRVDLGNHMIGADNLHTILCTDNLRTLSNKSYYYG